LEQEQLAQLHVVLLVVLNVLLQQQVQPLQLPIIVINA
jgi:hypothetical protein